MNLDREIDRLYALPLPDFISERKALARRLRSGGDRRAADEVKALAKPSVTAWAVNALYHHERERFDELLAAASAVRDALAGKGDRKKTDAARRLALRALLGRAAKILAAAGHAATPANRQRISHTLETLTARDPAVQGPRLGRLTVDLEPQGFDVLAGLAASLAPAAGPAATTAKGSGPKGAKKSSEQGAPTKAKVEDERLTAARQKLEEQEAMLIELEREAEAALTAASAALERQERLAEETIEAQRLARAAAKAAAAAKGELASARAAASKAKAARRRAITRVAAARRQVGRCES